MIIKDFFNSMKHFLIGHLTVFKHSFKKRVTLEYPEKRPSIPERFRGKHVWNGQKCIACKMCERVCPANSIHISKNETNIKFNLELAKCIFCGNCQYYCPQKAIKLTEEFELATSNKQDLNLNLELNVNEEKG